MNKIVLSLLIFTTVAQIVITLTIDATPLSIGIETVGGVMSIIIPRGSFIPVKKSQIFTTYYDNQTVIPINIFSGERPMTENNHMLVKFDLTGVQEAPKGVPQIEVSIEIDNDYQYIISARESISGSKQVITIKSGDYLSHDEIRSMLQDDEYYIDKDKITTEKIFSDMGLDNNYTVKMIQQTKKPLELVNKQNYNVQEANLEAVKETEKQLKTNPRAKKEEF